MKLYLIKHTGTDAHSGNLYSRDPWPDGDEPAELSVIELTVDAPGWAKFGDGDSMVHSPCGEARLLIYDEDLDRVYGRDINGYMHSMGRIVSRRELPVDRATGKDGA